MRLELRFLGGGGRAPSVHALMAELGLALGVEPQTRFKIQDTHTKSGEPLSFATFDIMPPNSVGQSTQPSAAELTARLTKLLGDMRCDSVLDATEVWSSDGCPKGHASAKLAFDGKFGDTLERGYHSSWRACSRDGSYEYKQTLRVRLRPPLPPGQTLLLRVVAPENGTAAFANRVVPLLGVGEGGGMPSFQGQLGPTETCVTSPGGAVEVQDGGISVAGCSSSSAAASEYLYLTGRGSGRLGEEGAGGLALTEVQACRPGSTSQLFALKPDGSFLYPTLARVDMRAGLQQLSGGGKDYLCGGLGKACVATTRSSVTTQLMPELVARHFGVGAYGVGLAPAAAVPLPLVVLCAAFALMCLLRAGCYQLRRNQVEQDGLCGDYVDSPHRGNGAQFLLSSP